MIYPWSARLLFFITIALTCLSMLSFGREYALTLKGLDTWPLSNQAA
jgi:hypothetical protein